MKEQVDWPKPYALRVESGVAEVDDDGNVFVPLAQVLYPGEVARTYAYLDEETGEIKWDTVVEPDSGFVARLRRLRFRLKKK